MTFAGTLAAQLTGIEAFEGVTSVGIGLVLATISLFLTRGSKELLIGEPARHSILGFAAGIPGVNKVNRLSPCILQHTRSSPHAIST